VDVEKRWRWNAPRYPTRPRAFLEGTSRAYRRRQARRQERFRTEDRRPAVEELVIVLRRSLRGVMVPVRSCLSQPCEGKAAAVAIVRVVVEREMKP